MNKWQNGLIKRWYSHPGMLWFFLPLEYLFRLVIRVRKTRLQSAAQKLPLPIIPFPIIVVGNLTVGGAGKTPIVISLVKQLQQRGHRPGVISRGYGRASSHCVLVDVSSAVEEVGDEPLLIVNLTSCPLAVSSDRTEAARALIEQNSCDILIADDGLQHYRLPRDMEIVVIDAKRLLGNKRCLPVGPLREPPERLKEVDWVLFSNAQAVTSVSRTSTALLAKCGLDPVHIAAHGSSALRVIGLRNLKTRELKAASFLPDLVPFSAVAGIAQPEKFFQSLADLLPEGKKNSFTQHVYGDHYNYAPSDFIGMDAGPIVMTSKDAVKCVGFARDTWWSLEIEAELPPELIHALTEMLRKKRDD